MSPLLSLALPECSARSAPKEECKNYFDLADHHNHHVLNKNDFVHFFQSSFIAEEMAPIFVAHPDDFTPLNSIPHEHWSN